MVFHIAPTGPLWVGLGVVYFMIFFSWYPKASLASQYHCAGIVRHYVSFLTPERQFDSLHFPHKNQKLGVWKLLKL